MKAFRCTFRQTNARSEFLVTTKVYCINFILNLSFLFLPSPSLSPHQLRHIFCITQTPPPQVSPTDFQNTMNELNAVLASAHDPYKSIFDNVLAILTLYLSPMILGSHYERVSRKKNSPPLPPCHRIQTRVLDCERREVLTDFCVGFFRTNRK